MEQQIFSLIRELLILVFAGGIIFALIKSNISSDPDVRLLSILIVATFALGVAIMAASFDEPKLRAFFDFIGPIVGALVGALAYKLGSKK